MTDKKTRKAKSKSKTKTETAAPPAPKVPELAAEDRLKMTVRQRILWVRRHVKRVEKTAEVNMGTGGKYMAVTHDDVTEALRLLMCQAGIFHQMEPLEEDVVDTGMRTGSGAVMLQMRTKFEITYSRVEDPEDTVVQKITAWANDQSDKGPGKIQSYGMKIGLQKMFMVNSGEVEEQPQGDPDDQHMAVIGEDSDLANELHSLAWELFGDERAEKVLSSLAMRRFQIEDGDWEQIPAYRLREAMASLKEKHKENMADPENEDQTDLNADDAGDQSDLEAEADDGGEQ